MADSEHLIALAKGAMHWNRWRTVPGSENLCTVDLREADLNSANLNDFNLRGADLTGATLVKARLRSADLDGAELADVNLDWAHLNGANLRNTDLRRATLRNADLRGASFRNSDLAAADLSFATVGRTVFADIDFRGVQGLGLLRFKGPCTIGLDTLHKSHLQIPRSLLVGAGAPDQFIEYAVSLAETKVQFHSCFISYSTKDQDFADRLYADLQAKGIRCWFAPHDVQGGRKLHEQIDEAIRVYDRLLVILSPHSINSEWVTTEIAKARKRELREQRQMLFPVRLIDFDTLRDWECFDADTGKDSARELREFYIPDFSNWKDHDSYHKAFASLIRDLEDKAHRTA